MKVLALADLHSDENVLDRLRVIMSKTHYDYVLIDGDLTNRGPISYVEELLSFIPNVYAVHGNMDTPEVSELLEARKISVHGRKIKFGDWNLVGFGGSNPTPFGTPSEMKEEEIENGLRNAGVDKFTILMTHAPPYGLFDSVAGMSVGSKAIRKIIEEKKPLMNICAHIHEHWGQEVFGQTLVVKLPPAKDGRGAEITIGNNIDVRFINI